MAARETGGSALERRFLQRLGWDGSVRWQYRLPVHHDVDPTPSGELIALGAGYRPELSPAEGAELYDNFLLRLSPEGELLEELSVYELLHAGPTPFEPQPVAPKRTQDGRLAVDLFHLNSVEQQPFPELRSRHPLYAEDSVLLCSRHQDLVAVVSLSRRQLVWSWGQGVLSGPHDATWLANGHLLIFDNGLDRGWSRVLEIDPLRDEVVWSYPEVPPAEGDGGFFTLSRGSAQRLPDGNTLLAESDEGRAFEVTPAGELVWEYFSPNLDEKDRRATIVRMRRHPPEVIDKLRRRFEPATGSPAP